MSSSLSQATFEASWRKVEAKLGKRMQSPRELVFLNGAPGSGKGTNTPFLLQSRGLTRSICASDLLVSDADAQRLVSKGELVPDSKILDLLLENLLDPARGASHAGAVIDGFPRTSSQVDFLRLLHSKLQELYMRNAEHPQSSAQFPRPNFKLVLLYVDEEESVRRQMARGTTATLVAQRAKDAGLESAADAPRSTDKDEATARRRYMARFRPAHRTTRRTTCLRWWSAATDPLILT